MLQNSLGQAAVCVKETGANSANDCKALACNSVQTCSQMGRKFTADACPGGLGEYQMCLGQAPQLYASSPPPPSPVAQCGKDKKGKWRKKKCALKIAKCSTKKKFRKKCKATCCAIACVGSKC